MKTIKLFLSILIMVSSVFSLFASAEKYERYDAFFKTNSVIDVNIEINKEDWQDMLAYPTYEEYHSASVTVDGVTVENAGIRTKGNSTLSSVARSDSDRYSFRIKFDKYVKDQALLGLDELCLNNNYSDASSMREYLSYEIMRDLDMTVPETVYCNLYINGELFGFYLCIEALDDTFLEDNFGEDYESGNFYKMEMGATLTYKEDENYAYSELKIGTDKDLTHFKAFVKALNDMPDGEKGNIESILDVDSALKYIAVNTVLCNEDSYNGNMSHNFYLYETPDGIFTVVPWDFNMSFGGMGTNTTQGIDTPAGNTNKPMITKLLAVEEYKNKYYAYIQQIMELLSGFEDRVSELAPIIRPYIEKDPTAFYAIEEFEKSIVYNESEIRLATENMNQAAGSERTEQSAGREKTEQITDTNQAETVQQPKMPKDGSEAKAPDQNNGRSFGSNQSIINVVRSRLANLEEQFAGTASKTTTAASSFGGGRQNRPQQNGEQRMPPQGFPQEGDWQMPGGQDGNFQPPQNGDFQMPENGEIPNFENGQPPQDRMQGGRQGGDRQGQNMLSSTQNPSKIRVHLDGHIIPFDTDPIVENDRTLVPFRAFAEAMDIDVIWNEDTHTVIASDGTTEIILSTDSQTAYVNGKEYTLDTVPVVNNDRVLIPLRFISENLNVKVKWDEATKLITLTRK